MADDVAVVTLGWFNKTEIELRLEMQWSEKYVFAVKCKRKVEILVVPCLMCNSQERFCCILK